MAQQDRPEVSVIVPVRDGLADLQRCVAALLAQDYPADRTEIIVADNGSADPPAPQLPVDPRLRVLSEPRPGSYAARNTALGEASGDVIAFTDADCVPEPGWLAALVTALTGPPVADMVGGRIVMRFERGRPHTGAEWYEQRHGFRQDRNLSERNYAVTANMATTRAVLDRVGLFDATLRSGGDAQWGRRVHAAGGRQVYAADAVVAHPARATWSELALKQRRTTEGVLRRHAAAGRGRAFRLRLIAGQIRHAATDTVQVWRTDRPDTLLAIFRYVVTRWRVAVLVSSVVARGLRPAARGAGAESR